MEVVRSKTDPGKQIEARRQRPGRQAVQGSVASALIDALVDSAMLGGRGTLGSMPSICEPRLP